LATTYAPPLDSYAWTVCVYESTTIASTVAIAIETGRTRCAEAADVPTSTTRAASVAYATDESGSAAKIGSASVFGGSGSANSAVARGGPIRARLNASMRSARSRAAGGSLVSIMAGLAIHASAESAAKPLGQADFESFLRPGGRAYPCEHAHPSPGRLGREHR